MICSLFFAWNGIDDVAMFSHTFNAFVDSVGENIIVERDGGTYKECGRADLGRVRQEYFRFAVSDYVAFDGYGVHG